MRILVFGYGQNDDGSINEQTIDRCKAAARVYRTSNDRFTAIYVTASAQRNGVLMAEEMRKVLLAERVHTMDIHVHPYGGNTAGEMDVFLSHLSRPRAVVFVSTWYHLPRIVWLALWRVRPQNFTVRAAWRHAHFVGDVLLELAKIGNALLRPRSSSKVLAPATT